MEHEASKPSFGMDSDGVRYFERGWEREFTIHNAQFIMLESGIL